MSGLLPTPPLWQRPSAASVATHGWLAGWTNRVAWTGAESSGGGPLLDGVSTFLGDGGLGQRDREPLGSRGLWFLCSSVLPSGSGAGVMAGVWRGVLCTHAVMVARRTFHGGGSVGALAVDGRRSRGRGPVWCAPRGTRRATAFYGSRVPARGRRKDRREDRRYPAATRRTAHADAPLSMGLRPSLPIFIVKTTGRGGRAAAEHRPPRSPPLAPRGVHAPSCPQRRAGAGAGRRTPPPGRGVARPRPESVAL